MPFNHILAAGARTTYRLTIAANDLNGYVVETEVLAAFGKATKAGDLVVVTVNAGVEVVAANNSTYSIDADTLHNLAELNLVINGTVAGRGGDGGRGENVGFQTEFPSGPFHQGNHTSGGQGGSAFRAGCKTRISGTGTIRKGFPGGGGAQGSAGSITTVNPGSGGGGGASYGNGGSAGSRITIDATPSGTDGSPGGNATLTARGLGGTNNNDGGNGGDNSNAATAGQGATGRSAGADSGKAVEPNGFTVTIDGSVTVIGPTS